MGADALFMELETREMPAPQLMFFPSGSGEPDGFFRYGMAERGLIQWVIDTFISADTAFVDIGAHVGTYTWTCGQKALHTYAFECTPVTFCHLAANVALYGLANKVDLHQVALGDREGETELYVRSFDGGCNGVKRLTAQDASSRRVRVTRLDTVAIHEPIGLIKMDVEGSEREVRGLKTLRQHNLPPHPLRELGRVEGGGGRACAPAAEGALRDSPRLWVLRGRGHGLQGHLPSCGS